MYLGYRDRKVPEERTNETLPLVKAFDNKSLDDINDDFLAFLKQVIAETP